MATLNKYKTKNFEVRKIKNLRSICMNAKKGDLTQKISFKMGKKEDLSLAWLSFVLICFYLGFCQHLSKVAKIKECEDQIFYPSTYFVFS